MAECNLGEVKLEPMQSAAVHGGFAFTGFVAGAFVLRSSYVLVRLCLP